MLKASYLAEVLKFFKTNDRFDEQKMNAWFVEREDSPRGLINILLTQQFEQKKILFVGHRGSGKTTELIKLAHELRDQYNTISFDMLDATGRTVVGHEDVMRTIATQVMRQCLDRKLVRPPLLVPVRERWEEVRDWWLRVVSGSVPLPSFDEANFGVQFATYLGNIEISAKQSASSREAINRQIEYEMPQLIRLLDWVVAEAEEKSGKRMLVVVEGLDKVDLEAACNIFRDHAATVTAPRATMIFTFPLPLRYSDFYNDVKLSFNDNDYFFPNIPARDQNGNDDPEGLAKLRELVLQRMDDSLIEAEALDLLVRQNGGIPSRLVSLVQRAAQYALKRSGDQISSADAMQAIKHLRRELQAALTSDDLATLRKRHADRKLFNDEAERVLLQKGALVDYSNGETWCDAHPVLWPLLEQADEQSDS